MSCYPSFRSLVPSALAALAVAVVLTPGVGAQSLDGFRPAGGEDTEALMRARAVPLERLALERGLEAENRLRSAIEGAVDEVEAMQTWNREGRRPFRNGIYRPLPEPLRARFDGDEATALRSAARSTLTAPVHGLVARDLANRVRFTTVVEVADAFRLRLRLDDVRLPEDTRMWVYGSDGEAVPFGVELVGPERELWTPSVAGSRLVLEVALPTGVEPGPDHGFEARQLLELFPVGMAAGISPLDPKDDSCLVDAQCVGGGTFGPIDDVMDAVAQLQFGPFVCTGSLINNSNSDGTPYLLTANHCISTQSDASSVEAYWDYLSPSCNSQNWPAFSQLQRSNGSTLRATSVTSDVTLLELNSLPGNLGGYFFLGWTTLATQNNQVVHRVSHPLPTSQVWPQVYTRYRVDETVPECGGAPRPDFIHAKNEESATFGGSSGSALLDAAGRVVGQLTGACGPDPADGCNFGNTEVDGAFATSFPLLETFLLPDELGQTTPCVPDSTTLCLHDDPNDGRFKVTMETNGAVEGPATVIELEPLGIDRGGIFWFIDETNPEVLLKILDGCTLNDRFWVFYAATTDVGFEIEVTDTDTGFVKRYPNFQGNAAETITDTSAFSCGDD